MAIQTLTGNEFEAGSAIDNSQTDQIVVEGANNIFESIGGNLTLNGSGDTATTVLLGTNTVPGAAPQVNVTDVINLDGGNDNLMGLVPLTDSTVTFNVAGTVGGNTVSLDNSGGTTTISLGGPSNNVMLNGDATNTVTTGTGTAAENKAYGKGHPGAATAPGSTITIGSFDDNLFGYSSIVNIAGNGNSVTGGDENFTISGGASDNTITVGDGENAISETGTANKIAVGGGDNVINAGGSGAVVSILGVESADTSTFAAGVDPDGSDAPVPPSPTDDVMIAGTGDMVTGMYENVNVSGYFVTSDATVMLGDGNDTVILRGTGGNKVTLGNGGNAISASGSDSTYTVGDGANGITLVGKVANANVINVIDPTGVGDDIVQLAAGTNSIVNLDEAAGSVTGTATTGVTTVTQSGPNAVTVNLNNGTGMITLGDGNDTVTANGSATTITTGNGNSTITANGGSDTITTGNGNNTITANGGSDMITTGNGSNTITAGGGGDTITAGPSGFGNNTITANGGGDTITTGGGSDTITANGGTDLINVGLLTGSGASDSIMANGGSTVVNVGNLGLDNGNVFLQALGSGDTLTVNATTAGVNGPVTSVDTVDMGGSSTLNITNGRDNITTNGQHDTVNANALAGGSLITANANNTDLNFGMNSDVTIRLNPVSNKGDVITIQAASSAGTTGVVNLSGFGVGDTMDLQGLGFTGSGATLFAQVLANMTFTPTEDTLNLAGGGSINFLTPTALSASEFMQSTHTGPVGGV